MKKVLALVAILFSCLAMNVKAAEDLPPKTEHEVVKIYLFYSTNCQHCHNFLKYFQKNYKEEYKDYFEIVALEVGNKENSAILSDARDALGVTETGVPLIVIGDFTQVGFGSSGKNLIEKALELYQNESYEDVVGKIIDDADNSQVYELNEALSSVGLAEASESSVSDGVFVAVIFIVLVAGLGGLVFLARK